LVTINEYITELRYFIKGKELFAAILLFLAIFIGFIDALGISLFYPMLSEGFQIKTDTILLSQIFSKFNTLIPIGSPFVHLGILFIFITTFSLLLQLIYWKIAFIFKREIVINVKKNIFLKIQTNDYQFFVDTKQGDLLNLFNQSPNNIELTYDRIISLCADFFSTAIIISMLFVISPVGMVLVLIGGGFFYIVMHVIGINISEKMGLLQIASGQSENKVINEFIIGNKAIIAHNASNHWKNDYEKALNTYWGKYAEYMFITRIPILALNSLFYISIGVVILFVYIYYQNNFISIIPVIGTFAAGTMKVLPKVMNMGDYKLQLKVSLPHMDIIYNLLHDVNFQKIKNGSIPYSSLDSDILFQNVSFKYKYQQTLKKVNFSIKNRCMTALIGPSGSGKSTIVSILLRLYDPTEGEILINGKNLRDYDINNFRDSIGYVSQDPFIFHGTIRENITFGKEYSETEIIEASKLAHAHEFIVTLPYGYDTLIGDLGNTLSGGEKQRIVIARAMIRRPDLLILDEATSSLDNESEFLVQQAIDNIAEECTTLIIAHRLTTIQNADQIFVLEKGEIIESGNHNDLINKKGRYFELWRAKDNSNL
jgi:ABC-type multidrug transport system fused ATPase/permease subunit